MQADDDKHCFSAYLDEAWSTWKGRWKEDRVSISSAFETSEFLQKKNVFKIVYFPTGFISVSFVRLYDHSSSMSIDFSLIVNFTCLFSF